MESKRHVVHTNKKGDTLVSIALSIYGFEDFRFTP